MGEGVWLGPSGLEHTEWALTLRAARLPPCKAWPVVDWASGSDLNDRGDRSFTHRRATVPRGWVCRPGTAQQGAGLCRGSKPDQGNPDMCPSRPHAGQPPPSRSLTLTHGACFPGCGRGKVSVKQEGGFLLHRPFTLRWRKNLLPLLNVSPLGLWAAVFSHTAAEASCGSENQERAGHD